MYFSPIFEEVEHDASVHRKAIQTCMGYPSNLRTADGKYYGEFETNDGTLPFTVVLRCSVAKEHIMLRREESNQIGILGDPQFHQVEQISTIPRALTHPHGPNGQTSDHRE